MKKIILTGGGTAGHITPILPIIEILKRNARIDYLYVGSRNGIEKEITQKNDIKFYGLVVGKRRNYISISNVIDLFKIFIGLIQSYFLLTNFRPEVIFAKGGYVTFPILFWAKKFNIPVIIHESDIVMGRANLWASHFAKKICLGFPLQYYQQSLPKEKMVYTGIPVKKEFYNLSTTANERPNILITGGSQGSSKINECIMQIAKDLAEKYEVYHLTGQRDFKILSEKINTDHYNLMAFSDNMPQLLGKADLIISRAGASTIAEIAAVGRASVLIPLPTAHMDHQSANAKILLQKNAAVVISEKSLTGSSLLSIINNLTEDREFRQILAHHVKQFAVVDSATQIVDLIWDQFNDK